MDWLKMRKLTGNLWALHARQYHRPHTKLLMKALAEVFGDCDCKNAELSWLHDKKIGV
jgi:hypothetical protein